MAFRPRITSAVEGIRLCDALLWRAGDGFVADLWHARGKRGAGGQYVSPDPRIVLLLDAGGGALELAQAPGRFRPSGRAVYVPAGMALWSRIASETPFRHLDLHIDRARIAQRLDSAFADPVWDRPLASDDPALVARARAIALACRRGTATDGAVLALIRGMLSPDGGAGGVLTPRQMTRVRDHVEAHLSRPIGVEDLARIAGLSESWFAKSFKRTTGMTPHRWLLGRRLDCAMRLIERPGLPLAEIAAEAGFADQAHMTRSFHALTGQTPGGWRRAATQATRNGSRR